MVNIVAVLIRAQTARQLTQQILLAQQLEEADEVGVGSLERLVQQGAALPFGNAGRREQTQVLRLGFDAVYRGAQLLPGKKSVAFSLTFRNPDRTLSDDDVNPLMQKILAVCEAECGASLRL